MNKVYFCNNGILDTRAMLTFGVSVKDDDAIGYFGTGLKYAIAIILRSGGTLKISSGGDEFVFSKATETIRGKNIDIVQCNGVNAGFTTHLGINWKPWMAYRELYSNCKDEGGVTDSKKHDMDTVIEVCCPLIYQAFNNSDKYFLDDEPIYSGHSADIHKKRSNFIYFKGVAVYNINTLFNYNLHTCELTEDRTAKSEYFIRYALQRTIQHLEDEAILRAVLKPGDHEEAKMGFDICWGASDAFVETVTQMLKTNVGVCEPARKLINDLISKRGDWPEFELTGVQKKSMDKAVRFLSGIGVSIDDYPLKTVSGLGSGVMGRAHNGVIYISDLALQMGTKQLASTLLEEWVHVKHGVADFDRQMQNWLFDKVLSIGEELIGEPL